MTKPTESPPSELSKEAPKASASLANVKVRRRDHADQPIQADKPGDLTQVLAQRRGGQSDADSAGQLPGNALETSRPGEVDAPDDGPTLRDRLTAQRLTVDTDAASARASAQTGEPEIDPAAPGATQEAETPAVGASAAPESADPGPSASSAALARATTAPDRPSGDAPPAAPLIDPPPGVEPPTEGGARSRRGWKRGKEAGDEVLRKRMEAALRAETRRREQAAARQNTGDAEDASVPPDETPAPVPRWTAPPKQGDIYRFWSIERHGRDLPALSNLDLDELAGNWPDSLLLRVTPGSRHMELEKIFSRDIVKDQPAPTQSENKIDYTPDVVDWVLFQGQVVLREGGPVRATEEFETQRGVARYRVVALPLGEDGATIDHILCQLEPV